jgi:hypothetical protein
MHPTADTTILMLRESSVAAGDAWRYAASENFTILNTGSEVRCCQGA